MKTVYDTLAKYALLRAAIYIALGVLVILAPETVMNIIVYVLAGYCVLMGIINIVSFFRSRADDGSSFPLVSGILLAVLGVILAVFAGRILGIISIFLGVLLIIGGVTDLVQTLGSGRATGSTNIFLLILSILVIAGGIVVIINPFNVSTVLFIVFGVIMVIMGITELVAFFVFRRADRAIEKATETRFEQ